MNVPPVRYIWLGDPPANRSSRRRVTNPRVSIRAVRTSAFSSDSRERTSARLILVPDLVTARRRPKRVAFHPRGPLIGSAMNEPPPNEARAPGANRARRVCYLSRRGGWIDPQAPRRPTSEVNLLAVYLGSRVWTLRTAWASIFHRPIPQSIQSAYLKAMVRSPLSDEEIGRLREVAERLDIDLKVTD